MKYLTVEKFMSWENTHMVLNPETGKYEDEVVRAVALCDPSEYFSHAINCMRDGSMGEKDENGVYERIWYSDFIDCYGDERKTLRPATATEVELFKKYCPLQEESFWPYEKVVAEVYTAEGTYIIKQQRGWMMRHLLEIVLWFRYLPKKIRFRIWRIKHLKKF